MRVTSSGVEATTTEIDSTPLFIGSVAELGVPGVILTLGTCSSDGGGVVLVVGVGRWRDDVGEGNWYDCPTIDL